MEKNLIMHFFKVTLFVALSLLTTTLIMCCKTDTDEISSESNSLTGNITLDLLNKEVRKSPDNAENFHKRAQFYYNLDDYTAAIEDMIRATTLDSTNAEYYHFMADAYMDSYQSELALRTMERTADLFPERIPTLLKLSEFQLILKQYESAYVTIGDILKLEPRNPEAYYMLGLIFKDQGNSTRAIQSMHTVTEIDSDHIDAWITLGQLYSEKGDKLALQCLNNAIAIDSTNIEARHSKAFYLQNNGAEREAIDIYKNIHRIDMQYGDAYLNAGILLLELDSFNQAKEEFHMLSKVDPANALSYYYLGVIAESSGEFSKALHQYKQAYTLSPDFQRARDAVLRLQGAGQGEL